jgi:hypothetical protein
MQRSQTVQLVRTLRATSRPSTRSVASIPTGSPIPVAEPGFPTGEEFLAKRAAIREHAARMSRPNAISLIDILTVYDRYYCFMEEHQVDTSVRRFDIMN